ncbi:MAG: transporter [Prevotella sp.]|nr:transporter [Prevotella sp.]
MKAKAILASLLLAATATTTAWAGGILTNTNQSIDFLRNPARDGAIGLDGVYSNPAGVAFLPNGLHLGLNWQYAHQTRTITSTNPLFALGRKNGGQQAKTFEGVADAPIIPSIQAAYNMDNWSLQFNFSVPGGGGKCEFDQGLGSFESVVGTIAQQLKPLGAQGYDMDGYMQGKQYYFGFQLGAAYKINENLSVYGGLRLLYGDASYKAKISNIMVNTAGGYVDFSSFMQQATATIDGGIAQLQAGIAQMEAAGMDASAQKAQLAQLQGTQQALAPLQKYNEGVNLKCDQSGLGFAPVLGIDYKVGDFNFAAKYEFKTQMRMENNSTVNEASEIPAVNKFRDGEKVDEDAPALLAVGAQWNMLDNWRLNLGYHHFFDKEANWYGNTQKLLDGDTNEFLAGVEWDITDRLTASVGGQLTRYGLSDEYMNDMSFVVDSYSFGFGANYKLSDVVTLKAAYFQTNYEDYDRKDYPVQGVSDSFTRTNRVLGIGCDIRL